MTPTPQPAAEQQPFDIQRLRTLIANVHAASDEHGEQAWYGDGADADKAAIIYLDRRGIARSDFDFIAYLTPERVSAMVDAIEALSAPPNPQALPELPPLPPGWISTAERMPPPETECFVWVRGEGIKAKDGFAAIDNWREQYEAPLSFSSATIPTGLAWDSFEFEDVLFWMPVIAPGARTALAQPPAEPVPGWRLVPVEPTAEMVLAAWSGSEDADPRDEGTINAWAAMVAASPQPERAKGELLLAAESRLRKFIDAAAGDGLECGGIDAGDLYCGIWGFEPVPAQEKDE